MTRSRLLIILVSLLVSGALLYALLSNLGEDAPTEKKILIKETVLTPDPHERTVIGLSPCVKKEIKDLDVKNNVSEDWEEKLVESLKIQGGEAVKEIEIKKVASFVWVQNDIGINVESVIVTVKGKDAKESLFKAMVDSETGKILETWDRPIEDPVNPKKAFRLKLDPRYFNQ